MPLPLFLVPSLARAVDGSTRNDAIAGCIVGERDYVASFLATLRNLWRLLGGTSELRSAVLSSNIEQLIGCDFALLLNAGDRFKLIYIEAKRTQKEWDRRRNPSPVAAAHYGIAMRISRFSDQIGRQAVWLAGHNAHFIAEMFLQVVSPAVADPPYDNPLLFDPQGSTFITHQRAREVVDPPIIGGTVQFPVIETWTTPAAGGGPSGQEIALNGHALNIEQLLNGVIECRFGEVVHGDWRTHIAALAMHQGAAPGDLTGYLRALGLRAILIVDGEAPPAWMG